MEKVSFDLAKSAGWTKPADLSGMIIGRSLMCCKTEVSVGNIVTWQVLKAEHLLWIQRKFYLCRHHAPPWCFFSRDYGSHVRVGPECRRRIEASHQFLVGQNELSGFL